MTKHGTISKLTYTSVALLLLASFTLLSCNNTQTTPSATATPKPTTTPTATATVKPTPTPTTTATGQPQYGGILRNAQRFEADSPGYPAKIAQNFGAIEVEPAEETLMRYDKAVNAIPWLATDAKADPVSKTITFTIRKGVKFQDGTDFNATAVKWNLDQTIAAKASIASDFKSIDVVDDYTVRVNLINWDITVLQNFGQPGSLMVSPTSAQANGADWAAKHPVGTGAFKFVSWNPGVDMTFTRFDGYWQQGKPYLDGVRIVFIVDDLTRELALRGGEIDTAVSLISTNFAKLRADGFTVAIDPTSGSSQALVPDSANPKSPFADVRVRQAAAYAINNAALIKSVWGDGTVIPTNQFAWPGYWAYNPSVVGYPYDPAKAKQLLTAAGYPNGFQTRIEIFQDSQRGSYGVGMAGYLQAVGINADIITVTAQQNADLQLSGRSWTGLAGVRGGSYYDWLSIVNNNLNGKGSFVSMLVPDDYSQAIASAVSASDSATEQKFAWQVMSLMIDKYALLIPQYSLIDSHTSAPNVRDTGLFESYLYLWTPEKAWMAKK